MNILLTGGSGTLGRELRKLITCDAPPHKDFDITKPLKKVKPYDLVIHCAAYTNVVKAEKEMQACYDVNVLGTAYLARAYRDTPFVYISSEYVKNPVNNYAISKLLGEYVVKSICDKYLIIRTLFKPNPFPYDKAFMDQWTTGDSVDVIAPLIDQAIKGWGMWLSETIDVGTGRKRIIDIARKSKPNIVPCSIKDVRGVTLPQDYV